MCPHVSHVSTHRIEVTSSGKLWMVGQERRAIRLWRASDPLGVP